MRIGKFFHRCYQTTYAKRSGHGGYLTGSFFTECAPTSAKHRSWLCRTQGLNPSQPLFFEGEDTLYGRYWGCLAEFDYLHFEACYYLGIEYCIRKGSAGSIRERRESTRSQRGFEPVLTHSNHWIADERLREAVAQFAEQESEQVRAYQRDAATLLPFKQEPDQP